MLHPLARVSAVVAAVAVLFAVGGCRTTEHSYDAPRASAPSSDTQQEISAMLDQYTQALMNKDLATLDRIWADDLTFINLRGELLSKQNRMDNIRSGATAFKSIQLSDKRIRVYGQVAVATFRVDLEAQYSGQEGTGSYRVTTAWARPSGIWQMTAVQMTRIIQ
jgi:ketosteroid isomerase-like protein